jgi:hypothetical protein
LLKQLKPLKVCSHTARKKKENFIKEERAQTATLLGSYPLDEPWKNNGKSR